MKTLTEFKIIQNNAKITKQKRLFSQNKVDFI